MDRDLHFSVATIAREPLPVLQSFLRWHLEAGAARILVYLDDPEDPARSVLAGDPRIDLRPCTPAFWAKLGLDAGARFTRRQRAAMTAAYREAETPWLLVLDADERMWSRHGSLSDLLARQPAEVESVRVQSAETVRIEDGGTALRLPVPREVVARVYGDDADLFRRRAGLVGHPEGKAFHRTGLSDIRIRLHWAEDGTGAPLRGPVLTPDTGTHLVHHFAPDYDTWRRKLDWRAGAHGVAGPLKTRIAGIHSSADPEAGFRALHDRLHVLSRAEADALHAAGGLLRDVPSAVMT